MRRGYSVSIFSVQYPFVNEDYDWFGAKVYPLNGGNNKLKSYLVLERKLQQAMANVHKTNSIDVIHSFWLMQSSYWCLNISKSLSVPIVLSAFGQDVLPSNKYLNKILKSGVKVVCTSQKQKSYIKENKDVQVIELGVNGGVERKKIYDAVAVGSLIDLKNHSYFIDVIQKAKSENPSIKALIIGDGPLKLKLTEKIKNSGLAENIELTGELKREETLQKIAEAKVLVHSSAYEGFGLVIIEALASRTKVLSSDVGIASTLSEVSILKNDLEFDANELNRLLGSELKTAVLFSIEKTVDEYTKVYSELIF